MQKTVIPPDLLFRVAQGDDAAFEQFYYLTYKPLFAFLLSLTLNQEDAQDLLQETLIRVHGSAHLYKEQGNPMAWVMKIGKNLFLMKQRQNSPTIISLDVQEDLDKNYKTALSFDNVKDVETRLWLEQLFSVLSEEERNIVIMHLVEGLKHREIADLLDIPLGTVLPKYKRALKKMENSVHSR